MCCLFTCSLLRADPEIHAAWLEPGDPPAQNIDYQVSTSAPASIDYPNVKLITGSLTWRIWSTDPDNPNTVGDIGVISSPYPENFGVKIEDDLGNPGAREVKAVNRDSHEWHCRCFRFVMASSFRLERARVLL